MNVEITTPDTTLPKDALLALTDVTAKEADIFIEALIFYKSHLDSVAFPASRGLCIEMCLKIHNELQKTKQA